MRTDFLRTLARAGGLALLLAACALSAVHDEGDGKSEKDRGKDSGKARDQAQSPLEVHEWSIWVGNPAQTAVNSARVYRNPMPSVVGTSRPKQDDARLPGQPERFAIAPISVVQFFGEPSRDVDVDVRAKKGMFLSHWPASKEQTGRLQWFGAEFSSRPPDGIPQSYLPETHWLHRLRDNAAALYMKYQSHYERFLAYDAELTIPIPVRIRGGPGEYTLQNLTNRRLIDVAVIAPAETGYRVGWLDELPTAAAATKEQEEARSKEEARTKTVDPKVKAAQQKEKAESLFREAEEKGKASGKEEELPPLPAEGDATVKARVDQLLNRPITLAVEQAPRRDLLGLVTREARLRYEVDDRALAKERVDLTQPASLKAANIAARDALADLLGGIGLSYRVTEEGRLFISTANRLAEDNSKKGGVIEGPPVKLVMSPPRPASDPSYRELTRDALTRRLEGQGLRRDVVQRLLDQYAADLFQPRELVVLAHFSREAIDETVLLDVFPPPRKLVRTALLVVHGVDPRLQDQARTLVKQLGEKSYTRREAAENQLAAMGPAAVPALEDALNEKDVEITLRAERLLLRLHRSVP